MSILSSFLRTTFWVKDSFMRDSIGSHYRDIKSIMEHRKYGEIKRRQYLEKLLQFAVQNSFFYSKYDFKNWQSFPVVNKAILIEHFSNIRIDDKKIPLQKREVFIQRTSGSTGTPFSVPQSTVKRIRRVAELKYFGEIAGFRSHERLVHLRAWNRWQSKSKFQAFRENIIPFDITEINDDRLMELCEIINKKKVFAIRGYASSIDILTRFAVEHKIRMPHLRLMIAGSEALQRDTREMVNKYIGCDIISQYANEENGILAQEGVSEGGSSPFYLNQASYYFEVLKMDDDIPTEPGEPGRIVLTDLFNYAFPMIRYDTGDTGILLSSAGEDSQYPVLSKLYGRRLDLVYNTDRSIVSPMAIARILKHYSDIQQWQFIQNGAKEYVLRLVIKNKIIDPDKIRSELLHLFGSNADIAIQLTAGIPVLASGKRKPVVNNWKV